MNDTPLRIRLWADMAMHLDAAQFGLEMDANPTRASVEYVRADLVPQPQEPTDAEVEAAARAIWERADDEFGWEASKAMPHAAAHIEWTLEDARAALLAGLEGRE